MAAVGKDYHHNLAALAHFKPGDIIKLSNGRLERIDPASNKSYFSVTQMLSLNSKQKETADVIAQTCQQLFDTILEKHSPLSSFSPTLEKERVKAKVILQSIDQIPEKVISKQLLEDLTELVDSPETLEARLALRANIPPEKIQLKNITGAYVMKNRLKEPWGIFKPQRQELGGDKNPNWGVWYHHNAEEFGVPSKTGFLRECAAYLLDKNHFADVPLTVTTHYSHSLLDTSLLKFGSPPDLIGSFQLYVRNCYSGGQAVHKYEYYSSNLSWPSWLARILPQIKLMTWHYLGYPHLAPNEIHKMAILDIRLLNCDRHHDNYLIDQDYKIHPIDHGLILPCNAGSIRFDWRYLIQSHVAFSDEELRYIAKLDPEEDAKTLKAAGITIPSIERMKLSTLLLKECTSRGMTLFQIADLMIGQRGTSKRTSFFENGICKRVLETGYDARETVTQAIENYLAAK